tara:strand:- start:3025 stop:4245 length:1221 start_codon:yes stop_codon:yes gene_type:complete
MIEKNICVIGLGYIGLPTAALLANKGYNVFGVDLNENVVSTINNGEIHIVEKDLALFVKSAISDKKLKAFNKVQKSDVYMICVPTPFHQEGKIPQPNIDYVIAATKSIATFIKSGDLIILESTSPVGTTKKIQKILIESSTDLNDVYIAYCPERVLPGKIMDELIENDRIVGGLDPLSTSKVKEFYSSFVNGDIIETDAQTAEMCKLAENSFRDVNIAFANELSIICDKEGINTPKLIELANKHPRVNILQPGIGVGGHCIAVDPWFIISQHMESAKLMHTAREVNIYKTLWVLEKIKIAIINHTSVKGLKPKIACLGLAFKPNIDDLRESKALEIAENLNAEGYEVYAVEPNIHEHKNLSLVDLYEAIEKADIVCILVKHREFVRSDIKKKLKKYNALDFCGALL